MIYKRHMVTIDQGPIQCVGRGQRYAMEPGWDSFLCECGCTIIETMSGVTWVRPAPSVRGRADDQASPKKDH